MALADYYERNAQAAAALVQGFDATLLGSKLEAETIGIVYDASVETSFEGHAAVDMCLRLLSRLYPVLAIAGLPGTKKAYGAKLRKLALSINPRIEISEQWEGVTRLLVFGKTPVKTTRRLKESRWYVGSDGWIAKVSRASCVGSGSTNNPLAAGAAACIAASNVFRAVFAKELGASTLDDDVAVSLLTLRQSTDDLSNVPLGRVRFDDVHVVGAGAIGNGLLWALSRMNCEGVVHVIDGEGVTDSNLQRYVMLEAADREKRKAQLASEWLKSRTPELQVMPHDQVWADYAGTVSGHGFKTVVSAVDSAKARIEIQASLPRLIYNGWTQRGEAGVSRHDFLDGMACLACLYLPQGQSANEDVLISRALRLGEEDQVVREVRQRLQMSTPTELEFLQRIATAADLEFSKIASFENRPLRDLYVEGVCGGRVMEFHQEAIAAKAEVPMGFQSALAGVLLAAELARPARLSETITQIDMLGIFPERPNRMRAKATRPACLCQDDDFIQVFKAKYNC